MSALPSESDARRRRPPGVPAGDFTLPGLHGESLTLRSLLAPDRQVLLLFVDPDGGPCDELLPDAARWQWAAPERVAVALLSGGTADANRARAVAHRLATVLLRSNEVAAAYGVSSLPSAVLVHADGTVAGPPALGPVRIRALAKELLGRAADAAVPPSAADHAPARAHYERGATLLSQGRPVEAAEQLRQAIALRPDYVEAHNDLGVALGSQGRPDLAVPSFQQALALRPSFAEAHYNLGTAYLSQRRSNEALASFRQALALRPDYSDAHYNLGNALRELGQLAEAAVSYRRATELRPDAAEIHNNLGVVLVELGQPEAAVAAYRRAVEVRPDFAVAHANLILTRHYEAGCDRETLAAEARAFAARHAAPLAARIRPHANDPDPDRRLRIGYVSGDFWRHPVGYLIEPLLPAHDPRQVETFCYTNTSRQDEVTERLRAAAGHWRSLVGLDDDTAAELIRADAVDILVDLSGHTAGHRLLLFARKPAPIQVTWLGNADTTGLATVDYLLADRHVCPPGDDWLYVEQVVRLPDAYLCYQPRPFAPPVAPPPARGPGRVTFGCFNNIAKVTPRVVELWTEILRALPDARLRLQTPGLGDPSVRERYAGLFAAGGIAPERFDLLGRVPQEELLAQYGQVDLALDPFPYNGCLTSLEALWQGVPLITLAGDRFVSRVGLTFLATLGLDDFVATSPDDYVRKAIDLAGRPDYLAEVRANLRPRMATSPLCDGPRFARGLEAAFRTMWRRWCVGRGG